MNKPSPHLLLSYYGDDFTGSTDVMEALVLNGVKTVLFLEPPSRELIASKFPDIRAFGVAGLSRAMKADEMERQLGPILAQLRDIPTSIVHYKICSTFDSSVEIGSIGRAIEIASDLYRDQRCIPMMVGVPELRRYTLFGNHFAAAGNNTYRLDRHPTMSNHPVTPMDEADLRVHLSRQTDKSIGLMNIVDLTGEGEQVRQRLAERLGEAPDILLFDVLDKERQKLACELIWEAAEGDGNRLVVGSSGIEYGLTAHWRDIGLTAPDYESSPSIGPASQLLVVSGSCSPVTEAQIRYALANGFVGVQIRTELLIDPTKQEGERSRLIQLAKEVLQRGASPLMYTAMGSEDDSIRLTRKRQAESGKDDISLGRMIGEQLGRLVREIVSDNGLTRVVVAGGDTSGFVMRELGLYALACLMPLDPGGPLCIGYSEDARFEGIEIALKGGQVGKDDYFVRVLQGK